MKNSYETFNYTLKEISLVALLFIASISQAQVGIGNTNPAATSMLDITSTEKGLLVPRMTTAQRTAIITPANSLLVYDTDLESFYHYDATPAPGKWIKMNSASNQRNNYVLVKSASDLPAPSGGKITLASNTFYEINGPITITVPIDLNDAYVAGLDANEDKLISASGPVFAGSTGGSIRNITITGGGTAFAITGGSSLLVQNTIIAGMASVGSIANVGLYFGNIVQFINNNGGITYENIGNLLLNNQAWLQTNKGTFETLKGTFGLVEKASGFSSVSDGATAFDVSNNPMVGEGVLLGTVFTRPTGGTTGIFVKKYTSGSYTGYNFTNSWSVNCPGIPREADDAATGDINLSAAVGSGALTSFSGTGAGSRTKVNGTTTSNNLFRFEKVGDNRITYRGAKKRFFQVTASVSYQATADLTLILYIAKGSGAGTATVIEQTKVYGKGASGFFVTDQGILALPIVGTVELNKDDYIEIWAERFSGSGNIQTVSLNLTAR